jgi:hypothetical protein
MYCRAKSIQISEAGQEVCILMVTGDCASTAGAARVVAAAAPAVMAVDFPRNPRREMV